MIVYYDNKTGDVVRVTMGTSIDNIEGQTGLTMKKGTPAIYTVGNSFFNFQTQQLELLPVNAPSPCHYYNKLSQSWVFEPFKYQKYVWGLVKEQLNTKQNSGLEWEGYIFDSDPASLVAINEAAQAASFDNTISFNWTLKDNSILNLSSEEMIEVALASNNWVQYIRAEKEQYRQEIFSTIKFQSLNNILTSEKFILT